MNVATLPLLFIVSVSLQEEGGRPQHLLRRRDERRPPVVGLLCLQGNCSERRARSLLHNPPLPRPPSR